MKFSEFWLREWVNLDLDGTALAEQLTMAGLEVNNITPVTEVYSGVIVGEIVECIRYSNDLHLKITKIDIGKKHLLDILCSAKNCRQGLKVAVATVGALLPRNFKVQVTQLYGQRSEGRLCSSCELGIFNNHTGTDIIELPVHAVIGTDICQYVQIDDHIIDINIMPNRSDCLSIIGMARDLAALNSLKLITPKIKTVEPTIDDIFPINVNEKTACPRYVSRIIKDIDIQSVTPVWMYEKLRRCGFRSVNPVVDITNYVMLELGQPMHAFDLDQLHDPITVRMAKEQETIKLLHDDELKLNNDTLVIADEYQILAIAGILGSEHSSIKQETQNVLLECAFFNPMVIHGRARRYGLCTDASYRYERGVDPALQPKAMERATQLLLDICGGKVGPLVDYIEYSELPKCATIMLYRKTLNRLIGHLIFDDTITQILTYLGCKVYIIGSDWKVIVPSWRFDIAIEEDLIEEIVRIYGYNNIPDVPIKTNLVMIQNREADLSLKRVKDLLVDKGYQEAITYSFVDPKIQQLLHPNQKALILPNPISSDMSAMRLSLWTGLLGVVAYNNKRQQQRVCLFESGLRFVPDIHADLGVSQDLMLAAVFSGTRCGEHWDMDYKIADFYDLKGDLESMLDLTGKLRDISFRAQIHPALHPGQSAAIYLHKECIGFIGAIHPNLEDKLELNRPTLVFELFWSKIADRRLPNIFEISRFPSNRRDISIVVSENVPAEDVIMECKKTLGNQLIGINLFDVYRGKGIEKGKKSLAISLILQNINKTLKEKEIAANVNKCIAVLKERLQATLRD